jgi:hypothetical protein
MEETFMRLKRIRYPIFKGSLLATLAFVLASITSPNLTFEVIAAACAVIAALAIFLEKDLADQHN